MGISKQLLIFMIFSLIHRYECQSSHTVNNSPLTEDTARSLLDDMNKTYLQNALFYREYVDEIWSPEILLREGLRSYFSSMQQYNWENFRDPLLKRQFQVILRGAKYPKLNSNFTRATHTLKSMSQEKWTCDRKNPSKCNLAFVHQIKSIFTNSEDLEELKYYWQEWRNKMPNEIKDALHYYISYYQNMSTPELSPSAVWYDHYEDPNLMQDLEKLMETIRPFYMQMHAHIRQILRVQYGGHIIPTNGLIPHHLFEQVAYQAWKKNSVLINPFPQRKLPNMQAELNDAGLSPFDLVNISTQFFGSLGFRNMSEAYKLLHFTEKEPGSAGPDCKSRISTFGDIELNYCPKVYYKKLLQTHGDMAQIYYAIVKDDLPVGLNSEACPGFGIALGEAVILSASTPKYLQQRLGLLTEYEYDDLLNLNRLYRMAVHTLLTVPTYFVHERLWVDMIDGKVDPKQYNCHYWNLMQKYMGVEAPVETNEGVYDMPYKFYEGIVEQYRSTKKIVGEFLGYQTYRAICRHIGEYQRGNAYKILNNCDFSNNQKAGSLLRKMMSAGSSQSWREIIQPLSLRNLTRLTATAFLQYFEPLHNWIGDDNVDKNLNIGWLASDKCQPTTNQGAVTNKIY